jgi:hypothetical protein
MRSERLFGLRTLKKLVARCDCLLAASIGTNVVRCGDDLTRGVQQQGCSMAEIVSPANCYPHVVNSVQSYLAAVSRWHTDNKPKEESYLSGVWFRGCGKVYAVPLRPGVYRDDFGKRAGKFHAANDEEKRRQMERLMLGDFCTSGVTFLNTTSVVDKYFIAQHHGMPTRLLDWTTNPLAGLFFAIENEKDRNKDGEVFIMEAKKLLPAVPRGVSGSDYLWDVAGMWHPYVRDAIGDSFWLSSKKRPPLIIPVRPDHQPGRIGQQSSCFTLHMHNSKPTNNPTLVKIKIPAGNKREMLNELHRMSINQFTIYNDLDHLSKDIKRAWEVNA